MPNARSVVAVRCLCGSNVPLQGANHAAVAGRLPVGLAVRHHDASFARSRLALFRYGGRCQVRLDPPQPCGSPRGDAPQPVRTNRLSRSGCTTARVIDQACPAVACGGGGAPQPAVRELVGASQLLATNVSLAASPNNIDSMCDSCGAPGHPGLLATNIDSMCDAGAEMPSRASCHHEHLRGKSGRARFVVACGTFGDRKATGTPAGQAAPSHR